MLRKVIDNFGSIGLILLLIGFFSYSVRGLWDWKSQAGVFGGAALLLVYGIANLSKLRSLMQSRSARLGGTALATLILVLGILVLLNFLNFRHHKRYDVTEGQLNALSEQTHRVLDNLEQDIRVIGFYQDEPSAQRFQREMQEYHYVSPRIQYEVIDPQKNPAKAAQYEITRFGQIIVAGPVTREVIEDPSEEKLTNAIVKVTREEEKVIYFLTGHGERSLDDSNPEGYSTVRSEIEKQNYKVVELNLAQDNALPEGAAAIVSAGPAVNFFPNEVQLLGKYLESGGKLFVLVNPDSEFEMNETLEKYGIKLTNQFVVDASGLGTLFGFGAAAPLAAEYADHPVTRDLKEAMTIFPTARSVDEVSSELGYTTTALVKSSPQSWGETNIKDEEVAFDEGKDAKGPLALVIVATKAVTESKAGSEEPEPSEPESTENQPGAEATPGGDESTQQSENLESRLAVAGDVDFAANRYFGTSVNGDLFLNIVSWLAEDTDLLSIRPKSPEDRSITLTSSESRLIFWATVILFPLATLVFGIGVWYRRR